LSFLYAIAIPIMNAIKNNKAKIICPFENIKKLILVCEDTIKKKEETKI
jgi:hypothetical protein